MGLVGKIQAGPSGLFFADENAKNFTPVRDDDAESKKSRPRAAFLNREKLSACGRGGKPSYVLLYIGAGQ